jgi:hypothetical protein
MILLLSGRHNNLVTGIANPIGTIYVIGIHRYPVIVDYKGSQNAEKSLVISL